MMNNEDKTKYLTIQEAASFLNLKESRLRYEMQKKHIPFLKIGRSVRFDKSEIEKWMQDKAANSPAA